MGCVVPSSQRSPQNVDAFISRWSGREGGRERSNYVLFLSELCDVIGTPRPDPAEASNQFNDYVFERRVERCRPDGTTEGGWVDLYKKGSFILEAKQSRQKGRKALPEGQADLFQPPNDGVLSQGLGTIDHLMINARRQAEQYAQALPNDHPYPLFLLTCDVGRLIEIYADFSGYGRHYSPFPDARNFRIDLAQLTDAAIRDRLGRIWENPTSLDPAQQTARVTREIAGKLAQVSIALEKRGFEARSVALFLMRCLFTMFVEDTELIRKDSFKKLLSECLANPKRFVPEMRDLWKRMDAGGYSPAIGEKLLRFNGKLFKKADALPLTPDEIRLLQDAARADWRDLEPAIFGTLFEQALDSEERRRLGAHYTPRAYVQRLVNATIMEPLGEDWAAVQAAAERALRSGSRSTAVREIKDFLKELSSVRVLDPACGTGNFLYVALREMKQLEGEVLRQLQDIAGEEAVAQVAEISIKPDQFSGLENNRRAVEIAELVLWIGYLQWHLRTRSTRPREPVLGDGDHILEKDAILTWDGYPKKQLKRDRTGRPVKVRNAKGELLEVYSYPKPTVPDWPQADFIVGNPPFIGGKDVRSRQGDAYAKALWAAHKEINSSADYVMYWWDHAAKLLTQKGTHLRRFGLVTTNSITQVFQRRVVERHLKAKPPVSIIMAIPDHPWTKATKDAAAVRIAMTVAAAGSLEGVLREVTREEALDTDEPIIRMIESKGVINADLTIGADITRARELRANDGLCSPGVKLHGDGFIISPDQAKRLGLGARRGLEQYIRSYRNGRDLASRARDVMVIDLFGLKAEDVRAKYPEVYEHLIETVKPERDRNNRASYRDNWWIFGEPRREFRPAVLGLRRYIVTAETTKHRVFQFLDRAILPDNMLIAIASDDAFHLGVLSSRVHVSWSLRAGGWLGVGNDPRYSKSRCFDAFPFPEASETLKTEIRSLTEELDRTRKTVLAENKDISLTNLYNVLGKIRNKGSLSTKDEDIKTRGHVLILIDLHERIDAAVLRSYGWQPDLSDEQTIDKLLVLNDQRFADEQRGFIRWLRPEYQLNKFRPLAHRADRVQSISVGDAARRSKRPFPTEGKAQAGQILHFLTRTRRPLSPAEIASSFKEGDEVLADVEDILKSLNRLGETRTFDNGRTYVRATT